MRTNRAVAQAENTPTRNNNVQRMREEAEGLVSRLKTSLPLFYMVRGKHGEVQPCHSRHLGQGLHGEGGENDADGLAGSPMGILSSATKRALHFFLQHPEQLIAAMWR